MKSKNKKQNLGLEKRAEVLKMALAIELMTSAFLASLLGIPDYKNSKTLGNQGSSISFSQKLNLLIEIGAIPAKQKSKFKAFMEIRNQFMHNFDANSYTNCFAAIGGTSKFILKAYPNAKRVNEEDKFQQATLKLGNEIIELTMNITETIQKKSKTRAEAEVAKVSHEAYQYALDKVVNQIDTFFEKEIRKNTRFDSKSLKGFGNKMGILVIREWKIRFDELSNILKEEQ